MINLNATLSRLAAENPDASATIDLSFDLCHSYGELQQRVEGLAQAWHQFGVSEGERVLWLGQNSARVLEGILACARLGAIFCPVNWRQSEAELAFVLEDVEPVLVLWQEEELGDLVAGLRSAAPVGQHWLQHDGADSAYEKILQLGRTEPAFEEIEAESPVLMLYTAAFGGQPNGALLSQRALVTQGEVFSDIRELNAESRYLNVGPLFHVATLLETIATFCVGGSNIFIRRAEASDICSAIKNERCNSAFLLPPVIEQIVDYCREQSVDISGLRVLSGSSEWNQLITVDDTDWGRFPYGFGQTETFGYASYCALGQGGVGTMGRASKAVEICMLDDAGNELPAGEVGEICVRGATVMNGYWRRPELNSARRCGDWHRCNDLGRLEIDGSISFIGPKARLIRSGQENIYPAEVESCLLRHAAVKEAAIIGVPDEKWDQSVKALLVLEEGATCSAEEIIEFCRASIASYKKPRSVVFVDALPRVGHQVDYAALDSAHGGGNYPGAGQD